MSSITVILSVCLCSMLKQCSADTPLEDVVKYTNVTPVPNSELHYEVEIGENHLGSKSTIFLPEFFYIAAHDLHIHKAYAFNVFINCKFASYAISSVYGFISVLPVFYQRKFQNLVLHNEELGVRFRAYIDKLLANVNRHMKKLIRVLDLLTIPVKPNTSYHTETLVLKTLLSIKLKTYFILNAKNNETSEIVSETEDTPCTISYSKTVQLLLIDMTQLQKYLSINCPRVSGIEGNSQWFSFWVYPNQIAVNNDISQVIKFIEQKRESKDVSTCSLPKILIKKLTDFFKSENMIKDVQVKFTRTENLPLKRIENHVDMFYDIDVVFMYINAIAKSLIRILFFKIKKLSHHKKIPNKINKMIKAVNSSVSNKQNQLPGYIVVGIKVLSEVKNLYKFEDHENYYDFMRSVQDIEITPDPTGANQHSLTETKIENLLQLIGDNVDDFICFNGFFSSINQDHNKLFMSSLTSKQALTFNKKNDGYVGECDFVENVYILSFQALILFNGYFDVIKNGKTAKDTAMLNIYYSGAFRVVSEIKSYCAILIERGKKNKNIHKVSHDVIVVLMNLLPHDDQNAQYYIPLKLYVRRILNTVMSIMSGYDIKYCTENCTPGDASSAQSNFLIFNKINFNDFGNGRKIKESMKRFFVQNFDGFGDNDFGGFDQQNYEYLNARTLYDTFIVNNDVCDRYLDDVKIHWKGLVKNIREIFENEITFVHDPRSLYMLYDVYFKFNAAIVFVEINTCVANNKHIDAVIRCFVLLYVDLNNIEWFDMFPEGIAPFLADISHILYTSIELDVEYNQLSKKEILEKLKKKITETEKKFNSLGITFKSYTSRHRKSNEQRSLRRIPFELIGEYLKNIKKNITKLCDSVSCIPLEFYIE